MTDRRTDPSLDDLNRGLLLAAGATVALAGVLAIGGVALLAAALAGAARSWYRRAEMPPAQLAKLKWEQTKAAAGAGAGAWRELEKTR